MKTTHTPAPWNLTYDAHDAVIHNFVTIASVCRNAPEWEANAHLIYSAPELLAALERLVHPMADDEDLDYAREIISKAKGEL